MKAFVLKGVAFCVFLFLGSGVARATQTYYVLVNNDNPVEFLTHETFKNLLLGKKLRWEKSGGPVRITLLRKVISHSTFLESHVGKNNWSYFNHWKRLAYTGQGDVPTIAPTHEAVVKQVLRDKYALGISSEEAHLKDVRIVPIKPND